MVATIGSPPCSPKRIACGGTTPAGGLPLTFDRWPIASFVRLGRRLADAGFQVVLTGMVRVVQVRGTEVVVRPVREGETPSRPPDDPLSQPIDTVVPDPFEEPPA